MADLVKLPADSDSRNSQIIVSDQSGRFQRAYCFLCGAPAGWISKDSSAFIAPEHFITTCNRCDQDIIEKFGYEYAARSNGQSWDAADQKGLDGLKKAGVTIASANPAFVKDVMARAKQLDDDWIKSANDKGVDGAKVLAEFRAELKNVAAGK